MMRSGTTLLQRLLAADPRFHCAYGWEVVEVAPHARPRLAGRATRGSRERRTREEQTRAARPGAVRHPPDVRHGGRGGDRLPRRRLPVPRARGGRATCRRTGAWIDTQDFAPAYDYLHRMLQLLQWQKRQRGETGASRWVLKTPAHLGYLDDLLADLPRPARRAPAPRPASTTIPVGRQPQRHPARDAQRPTSTRTGSAAQWLERMGWTNDRALADPRGLGRRVAPVTDVAFADAVGRPDRAGREGLRRRRARR